LFGKGKGREDSTKAAQAWDCSGATGLFSPQADQAAPCVNSVENASIEHNANEILLSSIESKCQIKTKMVE
jgi:hypothetical protein